MNVKNGYSITTHAGLIAKALWQNPELAFAGDEICNVPGLAGQLI